MPRYHKNARPKPRYKNNSVTSRSAFCKKCGKKLFLVDKYGKRKRDS